MKTCAVIAILLLFSMLFAMEVEAGNPFLSKKKTEQVTPQHETEPTETLVTSKMPECFAPILRTVNDWQKELKQQLSTFARDMKTNPFGKSFLLFLLLSFVYGSVHAIGPGHGKSVVVSYFLNRPGKLWQGIAMGHLITAVHVASGALVVLVMALILDTTRLTDFEEASPNLEAISYILVILIGLYLIVHTILDLKRRSWENTEESTSGNLRGILLTAIATGLVPCPGAALILLFSVILGVFAQGLVAMLFIALGMGLTTSLFAIIAITSRRTVLNVARRNEKVFIGAYSILSFGGAFTIILLGSVMLAGLL